MYMSETSSSMTALTALTATAFALSMSDCIAATKGDSAAGTQDGGTLTITVGEPFTIVKSEQYVTWGFWCFPCLRKCGNGSLLLSFSTGEDAFLATQRAPALYRSYDQGKTWQPDPMGKVVSLSPRVREAFMRFNKGKEQLWGMGLNAFCNLSRQRSVTFFYHNMRGDAPDRFVNSMWSSQDGGKTWQGPMDVALAVPGMVQDSLGRGQAIWHRAVLLKSGDLVTVAHTLFAGNAKLRVIALGSSDEGKTWRYLGTVAHDEMIDTEGFTEPILCKTAGNALICLMRTEGGKPMYQSCSRDGGKTWSPPQKSGVQGVAPDMQLLSNRVLACSYGRPDVNIMFSADGTGRQWSGHTKIFGGSSTCYTSFEEVLPGRLLYVFDAINFQDAPGAKHANCIRGVYINVDRVK
jgi:hypothetical protein